MISGRNGARSSVAFFSNSRRQQEQLQPQTRQYNLAVQHYNDLFSIEHPASFYEQSTQPVNYMTTLNALVTEFQPFLSTDGKSTYRFADHYHQQLVAAIKACESLWNSEKFTLAVQHYNDLFSIEHPASFYEPSTQPVNYMTTLNALVTEFEPFLAADGKNTYPLADHYHQQLIAAIKACENRWYSGKFISAAGTGQLHYKKDAKHHSFTIRVQLSIRPETAADHFELAQALRQNKSYRGQKYLVSPFDRSALIENLYDDARKAGHEAALALTKKTLELRSGEAVWIWMNCPLTTMEDYINFAKRLHANDFKSMSDDYWIRSSTSAETIALDILHMAHMLKHPEATRVLAEISPASVVENNHRIPSPSGSLQDLASELAAAEQANSELEKAPPTRLVM